MRILVTGGAGFIGSHVVDAFVERGHAVGVLDDLSSGRVENLPAEARLYRMDVRDPSVRTAFDEHRPDVLCHLAAQIDVRRSVSDPAYDADVNIVGALKLLELARGAGTRRVLFASTGGAMYGDDDPLPAAETLPPHPVSPYGVAKLSVESYLHYYTVEHGFSATSLRFANVYGPRQSPHGEAGVVAIFAHKLLGGEAPTIYGDGEQTRDFVYVGDVVRANVFALERDLTGIYNVGTGVETSVNRVYETMRGVLGSALDAKHGPARGGEVRRSALDARKLAAATGWSPSTSLEEGLRRTCDYFRDRRPVTGPR